MARKKSTTDAMATTMINLAVEKKVKENDATEIAVLALAPAPQNVNRSQRSAVKDLLLVNGMKETAIGVHATTIGIWVIEGGIAASTAGDLIWQDLHLLNLDLHGSTIQMNPAGSMDGSTLGENALTIQSAPTLPALLVGCTDQQMVSLQEALPPKESLILAVLDDLHNQIDVETGTKEETDDDQTATTFTTGTTAATPCC
jgi:hypothetical protein